MKEQKQAAKKKHRRIVQYRIGYTAKDIKERVLRFMSTFNSDIPGENVIELRDEEETEGRPRAYS
jgi:hypothetical protein